MDSKQAVDVADLGKEDDLISVDLILDDEGEPSAGFKCVGANSDEYQAAERQWKVRGVQKSARRGRALETQSVNGATELVEVMAKRELALCLACIKEVFGFTYKGAEITSENREAAIKDIFSKRPTWRTKTLAVIESEQSFSKPSSAAGA